MKFTQSEIIRLKKISAEEKFPMTFVLNVNGGSIEYFFTYDNSIKSTIKRSSNYSFLAFNSNGSDYAREERSFDVLINIVSRWVKEIKKDNPYEIERSINIETLSPKFYNVFQEADIINELGYNESSGMIYRKALELVVKDYFISILPKFEETILNHTVGVLIKKFYKIENDELFVNISKYKSIEVELNTLKSLAKKIDTTFKIGNDFAHYERKLMEFSSKDMKTNILIIIKYIDKSLQVENLNSQIDGMNNEFENTKLIHNK